MGRCHVRRGVHQHHASFGAHHHCVWWCLHDFSNTWILKHSLDVCCAFLSLQRQSVKSTYCHISISSSNIGEIGLCLHNSVLGARCVVHPIGVIVASALCCGTLVPPLHVLRHLKRFRNILRSCLQDCTQLCRVSLPDTAASAAWRIEHLRLQEPLCW